MAARIKTIFWTFALVASTMIPWTHIRKEDASRVRTKRSPNEQTKIVRALGAMPIGFEENRGQTSPRVRYVARGYGYTLFLCPTEAVMRLRPNGPERPDKRYPRTVTFEDRRRSEKVVRMKLVGANPCSQAEGRDRQDGRCSYLKGDDPSRWVKDATRYGKVRFREVYPGIDMVYYGNGGRLEYDLVVKPGADPGVIRLRFEGAERLSLDGKGDVKTDAGDGGVVLKAPILYEEGWFGRKPLDGHFALAGKDEVRFEVADHDRTRILVLDPVLDYSTYLGGNGEDAGYGIAVDAGGNAYVTGYTGSADFPTASPFQSSKAGGDDVFVTKLNAAGTASVYTTYLGGSGSDHGCAIAVDGSGHAYVTGYTGSADFPTASPFQPLKAGGDDAFVAKLDVTGTALVYSTFLGGNGSDEGYGIKVDGSGNAYVTGSTASNDFSTKTPFQSSQGGGSDAFVTKIDATGTVLDYSTYLGGSDADYGIAIAVDGLGNAYVTGMTASPNFPLQAPIQTLLGGTQDAFVTKLNVSGTALAYSSYLGGSGNDYGHGIAVDGGGDVDVTGWTTSSDFPTRNPIQSVFGGVYDVFVTKLDASGTDFVYSTYLGGSGADYGYAIAVDGSGDAFVTGMTQSADFPIQDPIQSSWGGNNDAFVFKLNSTGTALTYSTYLGGSGNDGGFGIAVDGSGDAYVTGWGSSSFPMVDPIQGTFGGGPFDATVFKVADTPLATATRTSTSTPTETETPSVTLTSTQTSTPSSSPTATPTTTSSATPTPTPTATSTVTPYPTPIPGCFYVSKNVMKASTGSDVAVLFCSSENGQADLTVYNTAGEAIRVLFGGSVSPGGQYQAIWDGKNKTGQNVASGVYLLHLKLPDSVRVAKVAVIR